MSNQFFFNLTDSYFSFFEFRSVCLIGISFKIQFQSVSFFNWMNWLTSLLKCVSKRRLVFAMQIKFWYLFHFPGNTRPIWKRFFAFFNSSVSPRFRAYKNEHNLQPEALKVTKSEFFDEKCVSFVSLCGAMGEDLVKILISNGF